MRVLLSKSFQKAMHKQSGKLLNSIRQVIQEVVNAKSLADITDLKKLVGYKSIYRIRIGEMRAFLTFHIEVVNDKVIFCYLVSRGEAYSRKMENTLREVDG